MVPLVVGKPGACALAAGTTRAGHTASASAPSAAAPSAVHIVRVRVRVRVIVRPLSAGGAPAPARSGAPARAPGWRACARPRDALLEDTPRPGRCVASRRRPDAGP